MNYILLNLKVICSATHNFSLSPNNFSLSPNNFSLSLPSFSSFEESRLETLKPPLYFYLSVKLIHQPIFCTVFVFAYTFLHLHTHAHTHSQQIQIHTRRDKHIRVQMFTSSYIYRSHVMRNCDDCDVSGCITEIHDVIGYRDKNR